MKRYIFLIRHGRPDLPFRGACCIGNRTDVPLSVIGKQQASTLQNCFPFASSIWCSPLKRSRQTAEIIAQNKVPVKMEALLNEIDVGAWEGLSFAQIKQLYPDIYAQRGIDWSIPPWRGETLEAAADRFELALKKIMVAESGDVVTVGHEGSIRALLWRLEQLNPKVDAMYRQAYGSITVLVQEEGRFTVTATGKLPYDIPSDEEIEEIWQQCDTPQEVQKHCMAVADECTYLCEELAKAGILLHSGILRSAALLHDALRTSGREHAHKIAVLLREKGYIKTAALIEQHHDYQIGDVVVDEAGVLYLADKLILGIKQVPLQERFAASWGKCTTEEGKNKHEQRYKIACAILRRVELLTQRKWEVKS